MQFTTLLLSSLSLVSAVVVVQTTTQPAAVATTLSPGCNSDNCARAALGGVNPGAVVAGEECRDFVASQALVTVTTVSGTVSTITPAAVGTLTAASIRNACGNTVSRYLSACSCRGVTRGTTTVSATTSAVPSAFGSGCNADNCKRGVFGSNVQSQNIASRLADCSTFLASVTVFVTPGVTASTTTGTPALPTYASACQGSTRVRFASVCRCVGAQETTNTVVVTAAP